MCWLGKCNPNRHGSGAEQWVNTEISCGGSTCKAVSQGFWDNACRASRALSVVRKLDVHEWGCIRIVHPHHTAPPLSLSQTVSSASLSSPILAGLRISISLSMEWGTSDKTPCHAKPITFHLHKSCAPRHCHPKLLLCAPFTSLLSPCLAVPHSPPAEAQTASCLSLSLQLKGFLGAPFPFFPFLFILLDLCFVAATKTTAELVLAWKRCNNLRLLSHCTLEQKLFGEGNGGKVTFTGACADFTQISLL